jgi:citrate lyase beta subunit
VNDEFTPSAEEIDKAQTIVLAFREAQTQGRNAVCGGSKMIDPPVVARALRVLKQAAGYRIDAEALYAAELARTAKPGKKGDAGGGEG